MSEVQANKESMLHIVEREGISAVWLVPLIALIFGGWLLAKAIAERGVFITIELDNANGIVVGKTEVRYRGLTVGMVKDVDVAEDLQGVIVEVEMIAESEDYISDKTKFWYVTADVSLSGIEGLDTLLSGSYINMVPDFENEGNPKRHFIGLDEEPPLDIHIEGLHIELTTNTLGSIAKNSPVLFKQMEVGFVSGYIYDEAKDLMRIKVFVEPEHAHLVKENSRFWNASGFNINGSLTSGVQIQTGSISSIVSGGIAFDTSSFETERAPAKNGKEYKLFENFQAAEMGHNITLDLAWDADLDVGAPIVYQGITVGKLESFTDINSDTHQIQAIANINPRVKPYLTSATEFFVEAPTLDLGGVTNMHRLLTGAQIGVRPSPDGEPTDRFTVYSQKPAYKYSEPGLHLVLTTENIRSLHAGLGVYFQQQQVGTVQAIENTGPNRFLVHIFIEPEYQGYVSSDSRFWNASGFRFTGGLRGFALQAQSVQAVLKGGIAFDKGIGENTGKATNGDRFALYQHQHVAKQRSSFELVMSSAQHVRKGTRIIYRGETIGSIHEITHKDGRAHLTAGVKPEFDFVLNGGSQFWLVKADLSLAGLTDTEALFGGPYFAVNAGQGAPQGQFIATSTPPARNLNSRGLQLALQAEHGRAANPGSAVSYRGINIGQVDSVALSDDREQVLFNITIDEEHQGIVKQTSRFYAASGITVDGGLSNFAIKTESVDALLTGGISLYNPPENNRTAYNSSENETSATAEKLDASEAFVAEGSVFSLYENAIHAENAGLAIQIRFNETDGLRQGMLLKYQGQKLGHIERLTFDEQHHGMIAHALLNDFGKRFAKQGTKFWLVQPSIGLVDNRHIGELLTGGYVGVMPSDVSHLSHKNKGHKNTSTKAQIAELHSQFVAEDIPPVLEQLPYGLNLSLATAKLGSVRVGNPVLYRQVPVGKVIGVGLSEQADKVEVFINIAEQHAHLVSSSSKFWNTSGVEIDAGLFSGVQISSESIESLLAGGIAFATPEVAEIEEAQQGSRFTLHEKADKAWLSWSPRLAPKQD
ncbi:MAG: PqiB family protein [Colwelliaceae bacterium]|nr:PqiB family protein [Colwelliaceae bacterium]